MLAIKIDERQPEIDFSNLDKVMNKKYYPYLFDFRRYQIFKGGASAGKSVFVSEKIIYHIITKPGFNVLVVRAYARDNHDTTFAELQKTAARWGMTDLFTFNRSKGQEEIICQVNGNKIIFRGLDDVEKVKSVTFATGDLVCIWFEEANQGSEKDFNQLDTRLRGQGNIPKIMILSFNPVDVDSWVKKVFFDRPFADNKQFVCESTYKDNRFLSADDAQVLESYKDRDYYHYKVYCLGEWGSISTARVFANIKVWDFPINEYAFKNKRYGMDFGFNHPNVYVATVYADEELWIYREVWMRKSITREFVDAVYKIHPSGYNITGDSEDPGAIAEFQRVGLQVFGAKKGPGSLMFGVNWLKRLKRINIHSVNCPHAATEFQQFKYRELRDGKILEEVVELEDDTIAAARYANEDVAQLTTAAGGHFIYKRR